ncbi:heat shock 70 kDa protein 16-like isoform X1 [Mangifera indica]|uniref:heat shock 70 kDa protein 16-like isoform X1 n=1 Tax=Mangifera indica TaxID=29780 RepID=UPI001CF9D5F0|nr:heat shock 70 kDa protein 16-like isoform X1 [Mangifera indica]XP_044478182.1 heat shock 70 kDa protein 16-like isoform X1 [Mangifera indica]XP_044478183.1 heat shock 70 kDa protein 16-like isoform X1 [Mangifera indica]XP_044478184.1 heat shock 70 kDa protein 16-like isoform X1 [Mangifera indica]
MSVLGFDIGNENCVIAVVKERGVDVLLNDESKRETLAVVSFSEKQRLLGSAGAASALMNPRSTISQVKRLIGRKFREVDVQKDLKLLPFETCDSCDGGILIRLEYLGETHMFTPVQLLGMLLSNLKQIAAKNTHMPASDCVIGIPCYFTDQQRRAYLDAATIAGLKPLRLMHDCTATALGYGIYKADFPNTDPTYVVFVDIGHCDSQVCIASFESGQMKILSHAFDSSLGGRDFDEVLFSYFAAQFKEQYNIDVYTNIKATIRLRAYCEKMKKVLSANAGAPLNIECLMNGKDVNGFIKREEFEKLSSVLLERIRIPCQKALADSHLSVDKIHSVELVGSGSRIPSITRMLASLFNREPSRTINASECVARGCALQCAMLSSVFRVREYEVQDSFPFSIGFSSDKGPICTESNATLFCKGQPFPSLKILTFNRTNDFHLEAFYVDQHGLPSGVSPQISSCMIGPFQTSHNETAKVKVKVLLDLHGVVNIQSASLIEEYLDVVETRRDAHSPSEVEAKLDDVPAEGSDTEINKVRNGKVIKRLDIPIHQSCYGGITKSELMESVEKENQLAQQDLKMERTKDKKNALESYVYEMRDKILSMYQSFASVEDREEISRILQETEDWLYEDGVDESENIYVEKLKDLKKFVDPIENRYKEEGARAQATGDLLRCSSDYRKVVGSLPSNVRDAYAFSPFQIIDECNKAEQWLQEKTRQQDLLPKDADPILWSSEIMRKSEALDLRSTGSQLTLLTTGPITFNSPFKLTVTGLANT